MVISKYELSKPVLPAPSEERGDGVGSGVGGGGTLGPGPKSPWQPSPLLLALSVQVTEHRSSLPLYF